MIFSKTKILLAISTVFLLIISGFFAYQLKEKAEEIREQNEKYEFLVKDYESLVKNKENLEKEIEIKKETAFVKCNELKIPNGHPITIFLLDAILLQPERRSPWSIAVADPGGYVMGEGGLPRWEGPMHVHTPDDIDDSGTMDMIVAMPRERKIGDYLIIIRSVPETLPTDTFSLQIRDRVLDKNIVLAENVLYSPNFLDRIFILRQTETGIIPIVPASIGCQF